MTVVTDEGDQRGSFVIAGDEAGELRTDHSDNLLTEREHEVLRLVAEGLSNRQVGRKLGIREKTVKNHLSAIFGKLGTSSRTAAAIHAYSRGWLEPPAA